MPTATILGDTYGTVVMPDGKEWMAENLVWDGSGAWFGDAETDNGWGRFYGQDEIASIKTAISGTGWRVPVEDSSSGDFHELNDCIVADGWTQAGNQLKAISDDWQTPPSWETDRYGWCGLPTGYGYDHFGWVGAIEYLSGSYWCDGAIDGRQIYMKLTRDSDAINFPSTSYIRSFPVRLVRDTSPHASPHLYVPHSGSWTKTNELHQGGGSWRKDTSLYVPHGGAWTEVAG